MTDDVNFQHGITAKVIADSVSPDGDRLTTIEATFHRFVLAEFNTHRAFSRNSASSRAIPVQKQIARVRDNPAVPVSFPAEQRGMQGGKELSDPLLHEAQLSWVEAAKVAVKSAQHLANLGVHKSVVNRVLEPYMWHTVIVSATDWQGFWDQRVSRLAQPEIRVVAEQMLNVYNDSKPDEVGYNMWHLPYIDSEDYAVAITNELPWETLKQISVARCARVSYLTHDGQRSFDKDIELYNRLVSARPLHASPLEHVAQPVKGNPPGNFRGWLQYRHIVEGTIDG